MATDWNRYSQTTHEGISEEEQQALQTATQASVKSKASLWTARIVGGIAIVFLLFDGVIHLFVIAPVVDVFNRLGYPVGLAVPLGITETVCLVLYVIPGTSVFGAVLLTAYLGGAIATQLRIGAPLFSTVLFPMYVGVIVWGGLYLRDRRLRQLIPIRRGE